MASKIEKNMKLLYAMIVFTLIALYINFNFSRRVRQCIRNMTYEGFDSLSDTTAVLGWIIAIMFGFVGIILVISTIKNSY